MSQISYNLVAQLLKAPNHVRGLAKLLKENQMTLSRKLRELEQASILDHRTEGRNKVYRLRNTLEAKQYCAIMEQHALLRAIKAYPRLRRITEEVRKNHRISLAVLFGSYAKGTASKASDIDIYICTDNKHLKKAVEEIDSRISAKIGRYHTASPLIREIENNHLILKGTEEFYERHRLFAETPQAGSAEGRGAE